MIHEGGIVNAKHPSRTAGNLRFFSLARVQKGLARISSPLKFL
ncbi:hypothetical protein X474_04240 [Dethiosulfatarculus sandiegensis]|uniref:Uncharacterized protein n=1 Tax=Dethiosulfatarculus sandiegensis TaxID=1429043 RepID=A0A0D2K1B8_9BACT|nr:hypothetical protein X474_04240 [Dethiosulfatarculus sandiegensis]